MTTPLLPRTSVPCVAFRAVELAVVRAELRRLHPEAADTLYALCVARWPRAMTADTTVRLSGAQLLAHIESVLLDPHHPREYPQLVLVYRVLLELALVHGAPDLLHTPTP